MCAYKTIFSWKDLRCSLLKGLPVLKTADLVKHVLYNTSTVFICRFFCKESEHKCYFSGIFIQLYILAIVLVQLLSPVSFFVTPWTAARQASLSFTISQSLLKPMSLELVMPDILVSVYNCRSIMNQWVTDWFHPGP